MNNWFKIGSKEAILLNQPWIEARFEPEPDITTYELAVIVQKLRGHRGEVISFTNGQWDALDGCIKRHFKRDKP